MRALPLSKVETVEHVARTALLRRNLNAGQRAAVVLPSATVPASRRVSRIAGVSARTVQDVLTVKESGAPGEDALTPTPPNPARGGCIPCGLDAQGVEGRLVTLLHMGRR